MQTHTFDSNGYLLHCVIDGTGPALVVIGSATYYQRVIPAKLRAHFTCYFIDHRGFAPKLPIETDPDDVHSTVQVAEAITLAAISADLLGFFDQLALDRPTLLGHSGHGYMAIDFAHRYPNRVSHLLLCGLSPHLGASMQAKMMARWQQEADHHRKAHFEQQYALLEADILQQPERKFAHLCRRLGAMRWRDYQFDEISLWTGVITHTGLFDQLWGEVFADFEIKEYATAFTVPTLLMLGKHDYSIAPPASWRPYLTHFSSIQTHLFLHSGHTPSYEEPDAFTEMVKQFIHQHSR
ncbi:alpha/beta fold hydrolase [Thaumasiovibrio subtropicus]|uniref:alpha/beta fold hydrolase n=1 Tax=Thaumasiovibrio subtropicus TaxID=1891207 RepID=UPI000B35A2E8|nr:alpha/beta hydrolase [Thaumasiovibrio subtropicus]